MSQINFMKKIPCYGLTFFDFDNFKKSIESLLEKKDFLDIKIIENYSKHTEEKFKPYIFDLLEKELISEYFLFDENVAANAPNKIYYDHLLLDKKVQKSKYTMITDLDLVFENDWLEEELAILKNHEDVLCVGVDLSLENLPDIDLPQKWVHPVVKGKEWWVPTPREEEKYLLGYTGGWGLLFRTKQFLLMLEAFKSKNLLMRDEQMHHFAIHYKAKWVRTKRNKAYHLTWDNYSNNDEYMQWKSQFSINEIWDMKKACNYTIYRKDIENAKIIEEKQEWNSSAWL